MYIVHIHISVCYVHCTYIYIFFCYVHCTCTQIQPAGREPANIFCSQTFVLIVRENSTFFAELINTKFRKKMPKC